MQVETYLIIYITVLGTLFSTKSLEYGLYYENGIKYLKQLRHPGVLVFLEKLPNTSEITLATERVQVKNCFKLERFN